MNSPIISLKGVNKIYTTDLGIGLIKNKILGRSQTKGFNALTNVNIKINKGEIVGLIGRNGAGKSTLLKIITGVLRQTSGNVEVKGKVVSLLELGSGFNTDFTGIENIYMYGAILGLDKQEIDSILDSIIGFTDIGDHINLPLSTYSTGMVMRLAFSTATQITGDVFIVDEALSVGDSEFSYKSFEKMKEIRESGTTVIFCTHSTYQIEALCDRVVLLESGSIHYDGAPSQAVLNYNNIISKREFNNTKKQYNPTRKVSNSKQAFIDNTLVKVNGSEVKGDVVLRSCTDSIQFIIQIETTKAELEYSIGLSITGMNNRIITSMGTANDCVKLKSKDHKSIIKLRIEQVPLLKGIYFLNINLFCEGGLFKHDAVVECARFTVVQECLTQGVVKLPYHWEIQS
jgi:lipopolysaccharide transport system ATP-binding protein